MRNYVVVRNDSGGTDVGCYFIPDDGTDRLFLLYRDAAKGSLKGLGEFARGVMTGVGDGRKLVIKIPPDGMVRAKKMIAEINAMETIKRAMLQRSKRPFFNRCGYGSDSSWLLVKAAPGLLRP